MITLDPSLERRGKAWSCSLWLKLQTGISLSVSNIYFYSKTYSFVAFVVKYCDNAINKIALLKSCFLIFSLPVGSHNITLCTELKAVCRQVFLTSH